MVPDTAAAKIAYSQITSGRVDLFYRSYSWKTARRRALDLCRNECQRCKAVGLYSPGTDVHHITPILRDPGRALDMNNLTVLCKQCHERVHDAMHGRRPCNTERW